MVCLNISEMEFAEMSAVGDHPHDNCSVTEGGITWGKF